MMPKVNKEHIALVGIREKIEKQIYNWGKPIVENLSKDLQKEFLNSRFSMKFMEYEKLFYNL
jgi:hypothetical protein